MTNLTSQQINILKYIAIFAMFLDHIFKIIITQALPLFMIGRISFIIFAFILAYNYLHNTSNKLGYIKRLFIFGIISQPFYIFAFESLSLNIFITLALGLYVIYLSEQKIKQKPQINQTALIIITSLFFILAGDYIDYSFLGIMLIGMIYCYLKNNSNLNLSIVLALSFLINFLNQETIDQGVKIGLCGLFAYLIIILISQLNITLKLKNYKWAFFAFYPVHLLILKLVTFI